MPNTIAENLQRLVDAKDDIAEAITAKGGTVASGDGLEEFAADIATIPSGDKIFRLPFAGGRCKPSFNHFKSENWTAKTWKWESRIFGSDVWTDGDNFYYSNYSTQCVLNKATSTWTDKTWNGLTRFDGNKIWTDG